MSGLSQILTVIDCIHFKLKLMFAMAWILNTIDLFDYIDI